MKTHNTKGQLTAYGLACGYFERVISGNIEITLTRTHGLYFVSLWNPETHTSIGEGNYPFEKLNFARKFIKDIQNKIKS